LCRITGSVGQRQCSKWTSICRYAIPEHTFVPKFHTDTYKHKLHSFIPPPPRHFSDGISLYRQSPWPRVLRRRSAAAWLLGSWVRIPLGAWMFVCCVVLCRYRPLRRADHSTRGVLPCVIKKPQYRGGQSSTWAVVPQEKILVSLLRRILTLLNFHFERGKSRMVVKKVTYLKETELSCLHTRKK
jgi:hypothetical protein